MKENAKPYRQILRNTSIIGGASVITIIVGLVRVKIAAVLLGPAGVGMIGLLTNLVNTVSTVAGLGFGNVGTRQIAAAAARNDGVSMDAARRALFWGTLFLAIVGGVSFWLLRETFASTMLQDTDLSAEVGWLALAVSLTVAAASQSALLNGTRRIGALAKTNVFSAITAAALSAFALFAWGNGGLAAYVIVGPASTFLIGLLYVYRIPKTQKFAIPFSKLASEWSEMTRLGVAFMAAGLSSTLGQLFVRSLVQHELGSDALGYFQAASTISMTYVGFVLAAMGTDYYPRLIAIIGNADAVNRMVNEQTEVALCLAGPVFLGMISFTPWVIHLLYASNFSAAADILRLQVIGDVLKIVSWPLGLVILAAGDGRSFIVTESIAIGAFILLTWLLQPMFGVVATGLAFIGMYLVHLPLVHWLARRRTGFSWDAPVRLHFVLLLCSAVALAALGVYSEIAAAFAGFIATSGFVVFGCYVLVNKTDSSMMPARISVAIRKLLSSMKSRSSR